MSFHVVPKPRAGHSGRKTGEANGTVPELGELLLAEETGCTCTCRKHYKGRLRPKATSDLAPINQKFQGMGNGERTGDQCWTQRCLNSGGDWMEPGRPDGPCVGRGWQRQGRQSDIPGMGISRTRGWGVERCLQLVPSGEETEGWFFLPRGHRGCLESARAVLRSTSRFYVYMLRVGFSFLSTFQSLLNSVPVPSLPLPACQCHPCSQPSGDIFPKHSLCMFKA